MAGAIETDCELKLLYHFLLMFNIIERDFKALSAVVISFSEQNPSTMTRVVNK